MIVLVEGLVRKGLSPQAIKNVVQVVKLVKASAVDEKGNELYPTKWNPEFIDLPVVDEMKQHKPSFLGEQVTKIVKAASGMLQMARLSKTLEWQSSGPTDSECQTHEPASGCS